MGFRGPYALDFGAILAMAEALGADRAFVAEILPELEPLILAGFTTDEGDGDDG